jgi:hypothetical protein
MKTTIYRSVTRRTPRITSSARRRVATPGSFTSMLMKLGLASQQLDRARGRSR